jgi:hypothetical protein
MKTKKELAGEIDAMANSFKLVVMEDSDIESMLKQFALTVQLYQLMIGNNYKLSSKEEELLKTVTK